jgi:hypothetical protein
MRKCGKRVIGLGAGRWASDLQLRSRGVYNQILRKANGRDKRSASLGIDLKTLRYSPPDGMKDV